MEHPTYHDYVADQQFQSSYSEHQRQFATTLRENDRATIERIRGLVEPALKAGHTPRVLDIGCSSGNFLGHLNRLVPGLQLVGGDLVPEILEQARQRSDLAGIQFEAVDILDIPHPGEYDLVVATAVVFMLTDEELDRALASIFAALKPGGWLLLFDLFHPFEQDLSILEKTRSHPDGLVLHFRPMDSVRARLERASFANISFEPFTIPVDLNHEEFHAGDEKVVNHIHSYSRMLDSGERLLFRGALCQPWCHSWAQKSEGAGSSQA